MVPIRLRKGKPVAFRKPLDNIVFVWLTVSEQAWLSKVVESLVDRVVTVNWLIEFKIKLK